MSSSFDSGRVDRRLVVRLDEDARRHDDTLGGIEGPHELLDETRVADDIVVHEHERVVAAQGRSAIDGATEADVLLEPKMLGEIVARDDLGDVGRPGVVDDDRPHGSGCE